MGILAEKKEKRYVIDNAQLMAEWNWEKNDALGLVPQKLTCGSEKNAWWKCSAGHYWFAAISSRNKGHGCPYCSGRFAVTGKNDLRTVNPILASQWNYKRNIGLTPENLLPNSNKKVWWICSKGHEWQATISGRTGGNGCPTCNSERNTSFPEYAIVYYLKQYGIDAIHQYKEHGYELDIYIPSRRIAIEYDGYYWHKNKTKKDLEKNAKCNADGITLFRIREGLPPLHSSSRDLIVQETHQHFSQIIKSLLDEIIGNGIDFDIDVDRDNIAIENLRTYVEREHSLLFSNPEIAAEWNYKRNGALRPEHYSPNSDKSVWWICNKGHEWKATIGNRKRGNGCPYCSGRLVVEGENDLITVNPALAQEWNYEKNGELQPKSVTSKSHKKVWWICDKGHEWQAEINARSRGNGCPYCSNQKVIAGFNDLQTIFPSLAKEWNTEKNGGLTPNDVTPNSDKIVWWICDKKHEWIARISNRSRGAKCPYCSGRTAISGENDLQTINPTLAREWNYEKNDGLTPNDVTPNSDKIVWWMCSKGHEWQATIGSRNKGHGCPSCTGHFTRKLTEEEYRKRLEEKHPSVILLENYTHGRDSKQFLCNDCGTTWTAQLKSVLYGAGCPKCSKQKRKKNK